MGSEQTQRYRLSLIPVATTFPSEFLHVESRSSGPPVIAVIEPEEAVLPQGNAATTTTGSFILGRNPETQIAGAADFVSRRLIQIRLERDRNSTAAAATSSSSSTTPSASSTAPTPMIVVQPLKEKSGICGHQIFLNGRKLEVDVNQRRTVQSGDVLALFENNFQYQITLEKYPFLVDLSEDGAEDQKVAARTDDKIDNSSKVAGAGTADTRRTSQEEDKEKTTEEIHSPGRRAKENMKFSMECPLCSEILSNTQSLGCGHSVCGECATEYGIHEQLKAVAAAPPPPPPPPPPPAATTAASAASGGDATASSQSEEFHTAKEHHSESWPGPANMEKCPTCQKQIKAIYPNYSLDNVVSGQVMSGMGDFDLFDLQVYLKKQGKAKLTEGEARSIFRKHPAYLSEYLESLKQEVKAPASAVPEAAPAGAVGEEKEGEVEEDEPQKKKARSSAEEIVIDDDDKEEEDSKDIDTGNDNNDVVSNNEVILID